MADKSKDERPIVIKKIKRGGHGHHGGAWKVAYADFVTAMMAFFLLMWLLNATSEEQKKGIADYFTNPSVVSNEISGAGGVMGGLSISQEGAMTTDLQTPVSAQPSYNDQAHPTKSAEELKDEQLQAELQKREEKKFDEVKKEIEQAIEDSDLKELKKNLIVDMTPEGLRIQIVDQDGESMFPSGSAQPFDKTKKLLETVGNIVRTMPNQISVRGHTDGAQYQSGKYTNWELSSERANASRKVLVDSGIAGSKIANVVGKADTDHLNTKDPMDPQNRRISIVLLRDSMTKTAGGVNTNTTAPKPAEPSYRKTSGTVQFP